MIHHGDCLDIMATFELASVDAIVTDPPYGLSFMGKGWDHGVPGIPFWAEMLRVAKPSAYLLAFGGTRTVHRMTTAIEDAGWIIRDMLIWGFASGFPKSRASLKPAYEPIVLARKPGPLRMLAIDACRIPMTDTDRADTDARQYWGRTKPELGAATFEMDRPVDIVSHPAGRWPANVILTSTEWYTLRDDVDQSARELIAAYFEAQGMGLDDLPGMRQGIRDNASVGARRSAEVLLPSMQLEGITSGQADGDQASPRVNPENEGRDDGPLSRGELASLEGRTLARSARLPLGFGGDVDGPGTGASRGDGSEEREGQALRPGASASDGRDDRPTAGESRGSPPSQRSEGRQPAEQPVPQGSVEPQPDASDDRPRTGTAARAKRRAGSRERDVTVPLALIPEGWRRYFRFSHDTGVFDGGWEGVVGGGASASGGNINGRPVTGYSKGWADERWFDGYADEGTYSRYFLIPKADRADREPVLGGLPETLTVQTVALGSMEYATYPDGTRREANPKARANVHPTVKPTELMRHLVRLVTPVGGTVLDPFLGSGTTGIAATLEGFDWIGIEKEAEYVAIAEARLNGTQMGLGA